MKVSINYPIKFYQYFNLESQMLQVVEFAEGRGIILIEMSEVQSLVHPNDGRIEFTDGSDTALDVLRRGGFDVIDRRDTRSVKA